MSPFSRRSFLGILPLGFLGWKWGHTHSLSIPQDKNNEQAKEIKIKKYNPLGNTGLKVSDVSFGA
ncbi:MAG: hypothetical protein B5M54_03200, partial [Candidatus Aminicenantes bacterium 4484_214]